MRRASTRCCCVHTRARARTHTHPTTIHRPGTKDPRIPGLYFAGASTRPGNGVPLCLVGSRLTAERVLQDRGLQR